MCSGVLRVGRLIHVGPVLVNRVIRGPRPGSERRDKQRRTKGRAARDGPFPSRPEDSTYSVLTGCGVVFHETGVLVRGGPAKGLIRATHARYIAHTCMVSQKMVIGQRGLWG